MPTFAELKIGQIFVFASSQSIRSSSSITKKVGEADYVCLKGFGSEGAIFDDEVLSADNDISQQVQPVNF